MSISTATVTPDRLASILSAGLSAQLKGLILEHLQKQADRFVADLAETVAKRATAHIKSIRDVRDLGLTLRIAINNVEIPTTA